MPSKTTKPAAAKKSAKTTAKKATKKTPAKKPTKQAKKETTEAPEQPQPSASPIDPKAQDAGALLVELIDKAAGSKVDVPDTAATKKLAVKLSKATATNEDLCTLRDGVNAIASALREAKQRDLASKFSDANRSVRRAERATRKA
jgi:hypothetical protein